jgi:hypothetical protein
MSLICPRLIWVIGGLISGEVDFCSSSHYNQRALWSWHSARISLHRNLCICLSGQRKGSVSLLALPDGTDMNQETHQRTVLMFAWRPVWFRELCLEFISFPRRIIQLLSSGMVTAIQNMARTWHLKSVRGHLWVDPDLGRAQPETFGHSATFAQAGVSSFKPRRKSQTKSQWLMMEEDRNCQ